MLLWTLWATALLMGLLALGAYGRHHGLDEMRLTALALIYAACAILLSAWFVLLSNNCHVGSPC